ncbi:MAG: AtpZ/AtpI family protein [Pseudomonadota bacterium]
MPSDDTGQGPERGRLSDRDRAEFKRRAQNIGNRLEGIREQQSERSRPRASGGGALGQALKLAIDPVVGVVLGLVVGLFLDNTFGTKPLFLIFCLLAGGAGGLWTMARSAMRTVSTPPSGDTAVKSGDDETNGKDA